MATTNLTVSLWRGSQVPPTIYHKWIKLDGDGNYLGQFIYRNGEWVSDLAETEANITQQITDVYETIENVQEELQTNIDNLESKHDSDKQDLTELINAETDRATAAESNLDSKIVAETDRATKAEAALDTKIQEETLRAEQAEEQLQHNINTISETITNHIANKENPHEVTKEQVGLGNVTNDAQVKRTEMGQPNGVATLDNNGKIPSTQLNGQLAHVFGVDGVATSVTLPSEGVQTGDIYYTTDNKMFYNYNGTTWDAPMAPTDDTIYNFRNCDKAGDTSRTNILYRWDGENLTEISESLALGEVTGTAYEGNKGAANRAAINSTPESLVSTLNISFDTSKVDINLETATKSGLNYNAVTSVIKNIPNATKLSAGIITSAEYTSLVETIPNKLVELETELDTKQDTGDYVTNEELEAKDYATKSEIPTKVSQLENDSEFITSENLPDLSNYALKSEIPTNVSAFTNDSGYITNSALTDYAKKSEIPDISGLATKTELSGYALVDHTHTVADITDFPEIPDVSNLATKTEVAAKQDALVSGTNIKTVNGESLLGSGDISTYTPSSIDVSALFADIVLDISSGLSSQIAALGNSGVTEFPVLYGSNIGNIKPTWIRTISGVTNMMCIADNKIWYFEIQGTTVQRASLAIS